MLTRLALVALAALASGCGFTVTAVTAAVVASSGGGGGGGGGPATAIVIQSVARELDGADVRTRITVVATGPDGTTTEVAVKFTAAGHGAEFATLAGASNPVALVASETGTTNVLHWDHRLDFARLGLADPERQEDVVVFVGKAKTDPLTIGNDRPDVLKFENPEPRPGDAVLRGDIPLAFDLADADDDLASIVVKFAVGDEGDPDAEPPAAKFHDLTIRFGAVQNLATSEEGIRHTIVWDSLADTVGDGPESSGIPREFGVCWLRIEVADPFVAPQPFAFRLEDGAGVPIGIGNNAVPTVAINAPAEGQVVGGENAPPGRQDGDVLVSFTLADPDDDSLRVAIFFDDEVDGNGDLADPRPILVSEVDGVPLAEPFLADIPAGGEIPLVLSASASGVTHRLIWRSDEADGIQPRRRDLEDVRIQVHVFDALGVGPTPVSPPFFLNNNVEPSIQAFQTPVVDFATGEVRLEFLLVDPDGEPDGDGNQAFLDAVLKVLRAAVGEFFEDEAMDLVSFTEGGATIPVPPGATLIGPMTTSEFGVSHTLIWRSRTDLPNPEFAVSPAEIVVVELEATDNPAAAIDVLGFGSEAQTAPFFVDNIDFGTVVGGGRILEDVEAGPAGPTDDGGEFLNVPASAVLDPDGNVYVIDTASHRVRLVARDPGESTVTRAGRAVDRGEIATLAGGGLEGLADGGPGRRAQLNYPLDAALAPGGGRLFIADARTHAIRALDLLDPEGTIATVAGGFEGVGGAFQFPVGVAARASAGGAGPTEIFFVEGIPNGRVLKLVLDGSSTIEPVAGGEPPANGIDLGTPWSVAFDAAGRLLVADTDNSATGGRVVRIDLEALPSPSVDVLATGLDLRLFPFHLAVAPDGLIYLPALDGRVRAINPTASGISAFGVTVPAGGTAVVAGTGGSVDPATLEPHGDGGLAAVAALGICLGVAVEPVGAGYALVISSSQLDRLRRIDPITAEIATIAGRYGLRPVEEAVRGPETYLPAPGGVEHIAFGGSPIEALVLLTERRFRNGIVYLQGRFDGQVRPAAALEGEPAFSAAALFPSYIRAGRLIAPLRVYTSHEEPSAGTRAARTIVEWEMNFTNPDARFLVNPRTVVGGGTDIPVSGGTGTALAFEDIRYFAVDPLSGDVFFSDTGRNEVWRYEPETGLVFRMIDSAALIGGIPLDRPCGIAFGANAMLICDSGNDRIVSFSRDGPSFRTLEPVGLHLALAPAMLDGPTDIRIGEERPFPKTRISYVADTGNNRIVRVIETALGVKLDTIVGADPRGGFLGDFGTDPDERMLRGPDALALDGFGNIYFVDAENGRIRRVRIPPEPDP